MILGLGELCSLIWVQIIQVFNANLLCLLNVNNIDAMFNLKCLDIKID